jgi:RNA polymerase sigma-70 factor (ECF subfamily)
MSAAEDQAFQEFAQIFGPRLRAFLISRGLTVSDAEDLAISCVTDISLRIEKYRPQAEGGFEAWVFTLARHFLADWWRHHKVTEPLPDNLEAPVSFEEKAEPNESIVSAVRQAVAQLSETDQLIVRLRYLEEERSFAEIGELLGIQEGTARVRLSRALKHLEPVLKKDHRISDFLKRRVG